MEEKLKPGEAYYRVNVNRMNLDKGRVRPEKGDIIVLGQEDIEAGVRIDCLIASGAISPWKPPLRKKEAKHGKGRRVA